VTYETSRAQRKQSIATSTIYMEGMGIVSLPSVPPSARLAVRLGAHVLDCTVEQSVAECGLDNQRPSLRVELRPQNVCASSVSVVGACAGMVAGTRSFACGGVGNVVLWDNLSLSLGTNDFVLESVFKVAAVANTAVAFVLQCASGEKLIGLDSLFFEGGSWGAGTVVGSSPLAPAQLHTLKLVRSRGRLSVALDGAGLAGLADLDLSEAVSAVGWRPWRNEIEIVTLCRRKLRHGSQHANRCVLYALCRVACCRL
jgi:hypothetical protein